MVEVTWTPEAENCLKEIYDIIALDKPNIAKQVINEVYKKVEVLFDFPFSGYRLHEYKKHEIRVIQYGHYKIVYHIKNEKQISIIAVHNDAFNIIQYLNFKVF